MCAEVATGALGVIDQKTVENVARRVIGDGLAKVSRSWHVTELRALHNDLRTEGLFRITGSARVRGGSRSWSAVVKAIDARRRPLPGLDWISVETEVRVYDDNLFANTDLPFRPARCYAIEKLEPGRFRIWLEDLCDAPQPPWTARQYEDAAYRLGRFNGHHAVHPPSFADELDRGRYRTRFANASASGFLPDIRPIRDHPLIRGAYSAKTIDATIYLRDRSAELVQAAGRVPASIAHGDCHARNLFPLDDTVVAVDWSGLAVEPIGADLGVLAGSGLSWGLDEAEMVVSIEFKLFSNYLDGLRDSGWRGIRGEVRIGFFAQFIIYAVRLLTAPHWNIRGIADDLKPRVEARFGVPMKEWPARIGQIAPSLAAYATELQSLLAS